MKHIKPYLMIEDASPQPIKKLFWLLPTDERFKKALKDIKCTRKDFLKNKNILKDKCVLICYDGTEKSKDIKWGWMPIITKELTLGKDYFIQNNYIEQISKYITPDDMNNYLTKTNILKYNL